MTMIYVRADLAVLFAAVPWIAVLAAVLCRDALRRRRERQRRWHIPE
jgi:hypothetical protein